MQVQCEERWFEHGLVEHLLRLEIELGPLVCTLHHLVGQLLDLFCLGVDPLIVEKFTEGVENGKLKVLSVHLPIRLLFDQ